MTVFEAINDGRVASEVVHRASPILKAVFANRKKKRFYTSDPARTGKANDGYMITRVNLAQVLESNLDETCIRYGVQAESLKDLGDEGVEVLLSNGETIKADICVGADGINSAIRRMIFPVDTCPLQQFSLECFRGSFTSQTNAYEELLFNGETTAEYFGKNGVKIGIALSGDNSYSWYLFAFPTEVSDTILEASIEQVDQVVSNGGLSHIWEVIKLHMIRTNGRMFRAPVWDRHLLNKWHKNRVIVIGDACHPVLPFIGFGGALAIEDAFELAKLVKRINSEEHLQIDTALGLLCANRLQRVKKVKKLSRDVGEFMATKNAFSAGVRNFLFSILPNFIGDKMFAFLFKYRATWDQSNLQADMKIEKHRV